MPSVEELKLFAQQLAKSSIGDYKRLEEFAVAAERTMPDVVEEVWNMQQNDVLKKVTDPSTRDIHSMRSMISRLTRVVSTVAEPYEIVIVDKTNPRGYVAKTGKNKGIANTRAEVFGIGRKIAENSPVSYMKITFYGVDSKKVEVAEVGKAYKVFCSGSFKNGAYDLSGNAKANFNNVVDLKGLEPKDIISKIFPRTMIADIHAPDFRVGYDTLRLIRGSVVFAGVRPNKNTPGVHGQMTIMDESLTGDDIKNKRMLSVMLDPSQVRMGNGSDAWFIGTITKSDQYGPTFNAQCIIPEFEMPLDEPIQAQVTQDSAGAPVAEDTAVDFSDFQ